MGHKQLISEIVRLVSEEDYEYPEAEEKAIVWWNRNTASSRFTTPPPASELRRLYDEEIARQEESFADQCRMENSYPDYDE